MTVVWCLNWLSNFHAPTLDIFIQARTHEFQRRGFYFGKSGPKPKGGLIWVKVHLFYYTLWSFWPKAGVPILGTGLSLLGGGT